MGGVCDCLSGEPRNLQLPDSAPGFAGSDISHLKSCMRKVASRRDAMVQFGLEVFADMFTMYPYTRDWFPHNNTNPVEIYGDTRMHGHVVAVLQAIKYFVETSADYDTLVGLVEKIALLHLYDFYVTTADVEVFFKCFIRQLKVFMGGRFNPKKEKAWLKFIALHNKIYRRLEVEWLRGVQKSQILQVPPASGRRVSGKSMYTSISV